MSRAAEDDECEEESRRLREELDRVTRGYAGRAS
jgi:hypothetical protein